MGPFGEVITAALTPFDGQGEVDYGQAWKLAEYLVDNGSDGLVIAGTTGESPTLTSDEKVALFRTAVEAVGDKAHIIAGTGSYDTAASVELTRRAAEVGVHGALVVTPYYSKPPQRGLEAHFTAIADASELPVMLYNIPGRTARRIDVDTLTRLSEHPRIVAVKDAVEDPAFTARTREACGDALAIYSGSDAYTLPMVVAGAVGVVSVPSHLAGPQIKRMLELAHSGDLGGAAKVHQTLMPLFDALFVEPNPIPLKAAMNELWGPVGDPRLPLVPALPETLAAVKEAMGKAQLP